MSDCETHVMEHTGFKCFFFFFPFSAHKTVNAVLVIISTFYILLKKKNRFHAVWLVRFAVQFSADSYPDKGCTTSAV